MTPDVVVITYESAGDLPACLSALPAEANVVVVDNASRDRSTEVAREHGARVVRNSINRGFAAAANQGAALGRGDLILFLNPDAVIDESNLRRLVASLDCDPRLFAVGPSLCKPDGTEQRAWWSFPSPTATWVEALGLHRLRRPRAGAHGAVPFVVGACLLARRQVFEALGGFDERFWLYGEEADLCYRAWERGWRVRHVADVTARHIGGASGRLVGRLAFEHFQRGSEHFILKHHGQRALIAHRLGLLAGSVLRLSLLYACRSNATTRLTTRRAVTARLARVLLRHPTRVEP